MCIKVTQWGNVFTRWQLQSKLRAHFDAIRLIWARLAGLLHT